MLCEIVVRERYLGVGDAANGKPRHTTFRLFVVRAALGWMRDAIFGV